ncbi:MAG: tyrosine-type recombinase/integrase [Gaiellaceae bacterium]
MTASLDRVRDEDGSYAMLPPKTRASRRTVPLPPDDTGRMRRHRLATGRPADGELVFSNHGAAQSPVPAYRAWKRACWKERVFTEVAKPALLEEKTYLEFQRACREAALNEPLPRFHETRHAFASHALAAGLTAHAVAALLGHSDAGLVLCRYGHALPDELASAGETLAAWRHARGA